MEKNKKTKEEAVDTAKRLKNSATRQWALRDLRSLVQINKSDIRHRHPWLAQLPFSSAHRHAALAASSGDLSPKMAALVGHQVLLAPLKPAERGKAVIQLLSQCVMSQEAEAIEFKKRFLEEYNNDKIQVEPESFIKVLLKGPSMLEFMVLDNLCRLTSKSKLVQLGTKSSNLYQLILKQMFRLFEKSEFGPKMADVISCYVKSVIVASDDFIVLYPLHLQHIVLLLSLEQLDSGRKLFRCIEECLIETNDGKTILYLLVQFPYWIYAAKQNRHLLRGSLKVKQLLGISYF